VAQRWEVLMMKPNHITAVIGFTSLWLSGVAFAQESQPAAAVPVPVPVPASVPATTNSTPTELPIAQAADTLSARTLVRLDQISRQLSEATGRIEALEAAVAGQKSENERLATLLDATRASQSQPTTASPASVAGDVNAMSNDQAAAIMAIPAVAEGEVFVAPAPPPISAAIMLTNARAALQSGSYSVAEANLTQLIWVYPASPEASEGRWLLGEARYVQSAWGTAAQAYVDYLKASPQGPRASEALLRLAGSFRQLGDNRQRCLALSEFRRRTPRPDATLKARADSEIARMTCPTT
jgi:TolA-binding protein